MSELPFPRPERPCGEHVRQCLRSAPPGVLERFVALTNEMIRDCDATGDLAEIMAAVACDAAAAWHEVDDQLGEILDGG